MCAERGVLSGDNVSCENTERWDSEKNLQLRAIGAQIEVIRYDITAYSSNILN